jgi:hypothetical protein
MRLAAVGRATDLSLVKLLLIISRFLWQVMACEDNVPNGLLMMKQYWTVSLPYLQPLPSCFLWHKPPSGINGQSCPFL